MARYLLFGILPIIILVIQSSVLSLFEFKPDFLLIIVIFYGLLNGKFSGAKLGFFYGLIEDLVIGKFIGINIISKMLTGYIMGLAKDKVYYDNLIVPIIAAFVGTVVYSIIFLLVGYISNFPGVLPFNRFFVVSLKLVIFNIIISSLLYLFFNRHIKNPVK